MYDLFSWWCLKTPLFICLRGHLFMSSRLGFFLPIACPLAWLSHVLHGWHISWYLRRVLPSRLLQPLGLLERQKTGISSPPCILERFLLQAFGMATFGWVVQSISGTDGFLGVLQFQVGICVVSSLLQRAEPFGQPWLQVAFLEPFLRWTFLLFAWFEPCHLFATEPEALMKSIVKLF